MATKSVQELNEETRFIATIVEDGSAVNVSSATAKKMIFKKADGTTSIETAEFLTDGSDGKIYYDSATGFLTPPGSWTRQGYVILVSPRTGKYYSETKGFIVRSNIDKVP